jgi:hypothetical protein
MRHEIRSPADLVAYLTDCTLATVADLRMKRSASKSETKRQIAIAQLALDKGVQMGVAFHRTRGQEVLAKFGGDCTEWAAQYEPYAISTGDAP